MPDGQPISPQANAWSGTSFDLETNDLKLASIGITFGSDQSTLALRFEHGESSFPVGHGAWLEGNANLRGNGDDPVAACGAWTGTDTFEVRICSLEDVYCPVLLVHCRHGDLRLEVEPNASWGSVTTTTITGRPHA
jgi:hypothetical protein